MSDEKKRPLITLGDEVLIVTRIHPAVFDDEGNCIDAGLDVRAREVWASCDPLTEQDVRDLAAARQAVIARVKDGD